MNQNLLYSQKINNLFRCFLLSGILIFLSANTFKLINFGFIGLLQQKYELLIFIENTLFIILFLLAFLHPYKIESLSIASFYYSAKILIFEPSNYMGIMMFFLFIASLYARNILKKNKNLKVSLIMVSFFGLQISQLRFGYKIFFLSFIENIGLTFVFLLTIFFIQTYMSDSITSKFSNKKLNIQDYPKLIRRDAEWLSAIIKGVKYEAIAIDNKMNVGSVKNRFKFIYNELSVGDKRGFLNKYSEFEIYYGDNLISTSSQ